MDRIFVFVAFAVVFEYAVEIAPIDHCHWAMAVGVPAVTVKLMHRILEPVIALLLKYRLVYENVVEHFTNLHQFQRIKQLTEIESPFLENNAALNQHYQGRDDRFY